MQPDSSITRRQSDVDTSDDGADPGDGEDAGGAMPTDLDSDELAEIFSGIDEAKNRTVTNLGGALTGGMCISNFLSFFVDNPPLDDFWPGSVDGTDTSMKVGSIALSNCSAGGYTYSFSAGGTKVVSAFMVDDSEEPLDTIFDDTGDTKSLKFELDSETNGEARAVLFTQDGYPDISIKPGNLQKGAAAAAYRHPHSSLITIAFCFFFSLLL